MGLGKILQYVYPKSFVVMRHTPTSQTASWFGQQQTQLDELRKAIADNIKGYYAETTFYTVQQLYIQQTKEHIAKLCNIMFSLFCHQYDLITRLHLFK